MEKLAQNKRAGTGAVRVYREETFFFCLSVSTLTILPFQSQFRWSTFHLKQKERSDVSTTRKKFVHAGWTGSFQSPSISSILLFLVPLKSQTFLKMFILSWFFFLIILSPNMVRSEVIKRWGVCGPYSSFSTRWRRSRARSCPLGPRSLSPGYSSYEGPCGECSGGGDGSLVAVGPEEVGRAQGWGRVGCFITSLETSSKLAFCA